jgi:dihydrofolate synthase/folylpolyglutamate synthase
VKIRTYTQALDYIRRVTNYERDPSAYTTREYNLRTVRRMLARVGNPHLTLDVIHVAGTKGKGSVCLMLDALLRGRRPGLFTSPHLVDMLERIQVDGRPISRAAFASALGRVAPPFRCTYFELMTAAAFDVFARRKVGAAIVEVGLGGRLDTTNVVRPRVCVINAVDYDHMDKLGNTLAEIAAEKAGIIKPGVPVVVGPQRPAARRVILKIARRLGCPVYEPRAVWRRIGNRMKVRVGAFKFSMPSLGPHQARNAALAVQAAALFGGPIDLAALASIRLPGRFERRGRFILDVAHNPVSARALAAALGKRHVTIVFGCSRDKDARSMLRILRPFAKRFILTRADHPRAFEPRELASMVSGTPVKTVGEALRLARGPTLVTGSFYVVGEAMARLKWPAAAARIAR